MAIDRMKMADKHEGRVATALGGRRTKASGSQWTDQGDGRNDHTEEAFAFAWDCKSTLAKSHTITTEMLDKLAEQSQGERPALPLRWYADEGLKTWRDWVLIGLDDLAELRETAVRAMDQEHVDETIETLGNAAESMQAELDRLRQENELLRADAAAGSDDDLTGELEGENSRLSAALSAMTQRAQVAERKLSEASVPHAPGAYQPAPVSPPQRNLSPLVPQLPWTSVFAFSQDGVQRKKGVTYTEDGYSRFFEVESVRVEPYGQGNRLFVNEQIVRHGDLWTDGQLTVRVGAAS